MCPFGRGATGVSLRKTHLPGRPGSISRIPGRIHSSLGKDPWQHASYPSICTPVPCWFISVATNTHTHAYTTRTHAHTRRNKEHRMRHLKPRVRAPVRPVRTFSARRVVFPCGARAFGVWSRAYGVRACRTCHPQRPRIAHARSARVHCEGSARNTRYGHAQRGPAKGFATVHRNTLSR